MYVRFSRHFVRQYDRVGPKLKTAFQERLELFMANPFNPVLNNHPLKGRYQGYRSINVTGDWRAIYAEDMARDGEKTVIFEALGTHSQLYK